MNTSQNQQCAFCELRADRLCPISGKEICSTTCLEISTWADEIISDDDSIYLEFFEKIRSYSKAKLNLSNDVEVANECKTCKYHWVDTD